MKLSNQQQREIRESLKKYLLSGQLERETDSPILVGSKIDGIFMTNGVFFDALKNELEQVSGKTLDWVVGIDGLKTFMGLTVIPSDAEEIAKDMYGVRNYRFVIELKGVRI